jgi:hypothetical protein
MQCPDVVTCTLSRRQTGTRQSGESDLPVNEPAVLFLPRGAVHSFVTDRNRGADLVCGTVEFGGAEGNPIGRGLPELVVLLRFASRASADL